MLKHQYKVIIIAVALGLAVVVVNSIFDYYFFSEPKNFLDLLLFDIPPREVYNRSIFMVFLVILGILAFHYFTRMTESEGRYRQLFDNVNDAIFVVSPEGDDGENSLKPTQWPTKIWVIAKTNSCA